MSKMFFPPEMAQRGRRLGAAMRKRMAVDWIEAKSKRRRRVQNRPVEELVAEYLARGGEIIKCPPVWVGPSSAGDFGDAVYAPGGLFNANGCIWNRGMHADE
jgi:hypothetical protein